MKQKWYRMGKVLPVILAVMLALAACSGSDDKKDSSKEASSATAEISTEPEKSEDDELLEEMAGKYFCVEVRKEGKEADPAEETLQMYDDYEALLSLGGASERFKVDLDRSGFTLKGELDGEKTELSCTYRKGVIHLELDKDEYVFAKKDSDRYKEWEEAREAKEAKKNGATGYYKVSKAEFDGEMMTGEMMEAFNMQMYIVLQEGGTAYMVMDMPGETEVIDLKWDEEKKTLTGDDGSDPVPYTLEDGVLKMEQDGSYMEFTKSDENAPPKPKSTVSADSTGEDTSDAPEIPEDSIFFVNDTYYDLSNGIYFSDTNATGWDQDNPTIPSLGYDDAEFIKIDSIGGPGVYDILLIDSDNWMYTFYEVPLSGGDSIVWSEVDMAAETTSISILDKDGNVTDYPGQAVLPE